MRRALVTGAARGIGRAIADRLRADGLEVVTADRDEGCDLRFDVASGELPDLGEIDVCVSNAAITDTIAPAHKMGAEQWARDIDVNLSGVFYGCRAAAPHLIRQKAGKVINLASVLAAVALPGYTMYAATKGAVIALTRTLAVEWARHNIQVNAIAPGWFVTEMNEAAFADPKIHERLTRDIPARRTGRLEEIGPLAVYLASPGSEFMTGQTIFLDGGQTVA